MILLLLLVLFVLWRLRRPVFHVSRGARAFAHTTREPHGEAVCVSHTLWIGVMDEALGAPLFLRHARACARASLPLLHHSPSTRLYTRIAPIPKAEAPPPPPLSAKRRRLGIALLRAAMDAWHAAMDAWTAYAQRRTKDKLVLAMAASLFNASDRADHDVIVQFSLSHATLRVLLDRIAASARAHTLTLFTHQQDLHRVRPGFHIDSSDGAVVLTLQHTVYLLKTHNNP